MDNVFDKGYAVNGGNQFGNFASRLATEYQPARDLSGVWKFRPDRKSEGESQRWFNGLTQARLIPVPCSWNEIFDDVRSYTGAAWYQSEFRVDQGWNGQRIHLRLGAVTYLAKAWLNGTLLGEHEGGSLPFVFDVTPHLKPGEENVLVVFVENELRLDRVPSIPDTSRFSLHTHLVERDKNHPCVVLWSVANEPILNPFHTTNTEPKGAAEAGTKFFAPLFDLFHKLDSTRPVTLVSVQGGPMDWQTFGDVICTNSYDGWYAISGQIDEAQKMLEQEVVQLRARHPNKPIMLKGVFTRDRNPKVTALRLRQLWVERKS